jgi:hypothetical protein
VQQDHLALDLGQLRQSREKPLPKLAAFHLRSGRHASGYLVQLQRLSGPCCVIPDKIAGPVADDLEQPAAEARRVSAAVDPLDCRDECILASVIGVSFVPGDRKGDGSAAPEIALQEPLRGSGITGPDSGHQYCIGFLHRPFLDTRGSESVEVV